LPICATSLPLRRTPVAGWESHALQLVPLSTVDGIGECVHGCLWPRLNQEQARAERQRHSKSERVGWLTALRRARSLTWCIETAELARAWPPTPSCCCWTNLAGPTRRGTASMDLIQAFAEKYHYHGGTSGEGVSVCPIGSWYSPRAKRSPGTLAEVANNPRDRRVSGKQTYATHRMWPRPVAMSGPLGRVAGRAGLDRGAHRPNGQAR
jgi:hypothetical protein